LLKCAKKLQVFALILLTSALLLAAINPNIASVKAQGQATIVVMAALGGTTDPSGTTTYDDGTPVTLTATAGDGFVFQNWEIATSAGANIVYDNPATLTVSGGVSYGVQAFFAPIQAPPGTTATANLATAAIVVVLAAAGGTTTPAPGTYALDSAASLMLTATPDSGWVFHNWIISGTPLTHGAYSFTATPTDNPYNVNHGYGNTYTYQPVFSPISPTVSNAPTATPTSTMGGISDTAIIIALAVVLVIVVIAFGAFAYMKRSKK